MAIWHKEVVRVDGDLKVYIKVQDDYYGTIKGSLRDIHLDGDMYYCRADGHRIDVTDARRNFLAYEDKVKSALDWYDKTSFTKHSSFRD